MLLHLKPASRGPLSAVILPWPRSIVPPPRQSDLPLAAFFGHRAGVLRLAESAENEPTATQMAIAAVKHAMAQDQSGVLVEILQRREDSRQFTPRELLDTSEMMIEALVAVQALYNKAVAALEAKN